MKILIGVSFLFLVLLTVAVSTLLHTWFKYDAGYEWDDDDRD